MDTADQPVLKEDLDGQCPQDRVGHTKAMDSSSQALRIDGFKGDTGWLSNFAYAPATYEGVEYPTREHAFNAAKTLNLSERELVRQASTPGLAKKLGRSAVTLRADWDSVVRYEAMAEVCASSYVGPLADKLTSTGDKLLLETNTWHDQHWGDCECPMHTHILGANHLGRTLMRLRDTLAGAPRTASGEKWTRVMVTGHRDKFLTGPQKEWINTQLSRIAEKLVNDYGTKVAIHGGANGADLAWANTASAANLELWAYLPFPQQTKGWNQSQIEDWERVTTLTFFGGLSTYTRYLDKEYSVAALHRRNEWMLRDADAVIAIYDPTKTTGGTVETLKKVGTTLPVIRLDIKNEKVTISPRK
jgi:ribA/ribD-fused uncharacterized protein